MDEELVGQYGSVVFMVLLISFGLVRADIKSFKPQSWILKTRIVASQQFLDFTRGLFLEAPGNYRTC